MFKLLGSCFGKLLVLLLLLESALVCASGNDEVLKNMESGFAEFRAGKLKPAERLFDQVLNNIETVFADSESARKARSLWYSEDNKAYKGEPYERSMAYYYRGLLYLLNTEYGNARASFLGGLMQDAFAEEAQHRSDFASLMLLSAWSARLMGSAYLEKDGFEELLKFRPDFILPDASHNTLVVVETGAAPRKLADGIGHYELVYRKGKGLEDVTVALSSKGASLNLYPIEDLFWQASTRGGRQVDRIIKGKAVFKSEQAAFGSGLSKAANNALVVSELFEESSEIALISGALSLIGVGQMAVSTKVDARVDTRYWSTLPAMLHVQTLHLDQNVNELDFSFIDDFDDPLAELNQSAKVVWDKNGHGLVWLRVE